MASGGGGKNRVRGEVVVIPVVHGSVAVWQGKKAPADRTHRWTVYLRGHPASTDLSYAIQKVEFHLHSSFSPPVRVMEEPPFEVTEFGWGEFEVTIRVHFVGGGVEKPVDLYHPLKLFPGPGNQELTKNPVDSEFYDEIVIQDPPEALHSLLKRGPKTLPSTKQSALMEFFHDFSGKESEDLEKITRARKKVQDDVEAKTQRYRELNAERDRLIFEITRMGGRA